MTQPCIILGIETSCDETSAAVVVDGRAVRSNLVSSQVDLHARFGGVVPELAARAHVERIQPIIAEAMAQGGVTQADLAAIAVTDGPGLVGSLLVGVTAAKTLSLTWDLPLVAVDHIEAHCTSAALAEAEAGAERSRDREIERSSEEDDTGGGPTSSPAPASPQPRDRQVRSLDLSISRFPPPWPAVALVVSGGHTSLYLVRDFLDIELLGQTIDDAAGEAFDKVAAILELGFPGGPAVDRVARDGDPAAIEFPRTWLSPGSLDFSFSGLKTAVLYHVHGPGRKYGSLDHLSAKQIADVAASFQAALVEVLVGKTLAAAEAAGVGTVVVGGGVAANSALRSALATACDGAGRRLILTPMKYCTDNAAMIAALGYHRLQAGHVADLDLEPRAGLVRKPRASSLSRAAGRRPSGETPK